MIKLKVRFYEYQISLDAFTFDSTTFDYPIFYFSEGLSWRRTDFNYHIIDCLSLESWPSLFATFRIGGPAPGRDLDFRLRGSASSIPSLDHRHRSPSSRRALHVDVTGNNLSLPTINSDQVRFGTDGRTWRRFIATNVVPVSRFKSATVLSII